MTKKMDVASLVEFNSAHFINNNEDIKEYIRITEEEGDISAFREVLNTIFLAIGANAVATAMGMSADRVWDVQNQPSDHLDDLKKILAFLKEDVSESFPLNPHLGSNFEDFLKEQGIYDEVNAAAIRNVITAIKKQNRNEG